jgi:XTP/dITP diphosphohydrolase
LIVNGKEILLEGICPGEIATEKRGTGGFGYDPVFIPEGHTATFAELGDDVKNQISHRAKATLQLVQTLKAIENQ